MASSSQLHSPRSSDNISFWDNPAPSGYNHEFIDEIDKELLCLRCKFVTREPNITTCCGELFCKGCISPYHRDSQPCPAPDCGKTDFNIYLNGRYQKKIQSLKLYCPMKRHGCKWIGQLQQLESHMDVQSGDCMYVDIECPSHCDQKVRKKDVSDHISWQCPLRDYTCPHCNLKASFKLISEEHWGVCPYYPIPCPNRCGVTYEREAEEDHMKMCNKKELVCCFSHVGCQGKFLREGEEKHMEVNAREHLSLMAAAMLKMEKRTEEQEVRFQEKLKEQEVRFQEKLQEQKAEFEKYFQNEKEELERKIDRGAAELKLAVEDLQLNTGYIFHYPVVFTVPSFKQLMIRDTVWCSPVLHTPYESFGGYGFHIEVYPDGSLLGGHGTHMSVHCRPNPGPYDYRLKWPVTLTVTLQLLNQHADKEHITKQVTWTYSKEDCRLKVIDHNFISHEKLDWNPDKETQYLKNNCVQFKIVEAVGIKF